MAVMRNRGRWSPERRADAYVELEHPSDLFLEIHGQDPGELAENALFAFYDQIAEIQGFDTLLEQTIETSGAGLDDALRSLLSEALYLFDTEGFVAAGGKVDARMPEGPDGGWSLSAHLWGDKAGRERHALLHEVKAVTYHRLSVTRSGGGWRATVLLDI
jgi:SHS2 domain-containing protein